MNSKSLEPSYLILILLGAFFVLAPTPYPLYFSYNEKRLFQLGILCALTILTLAHRPTRISIQAQLMGFPKITQGALALIGTLAILSSVLAESPRLSFRGLCLYLGLFILFLAIAQIRDKIGAFFDQFILASLLVSAFLFEASFFLIYFGALFTHSSLVFPEPFSGFENYRFFNQYQVGTIFLLILPLVLYPKLPRTSRIIIYFLNIGWWVTLFYLSGRGSIGAALLSPLITWLLLGKRANVFLLKYLQVLILGFLIYAVLFYLIPSFVDFLTGSRALEQALQPGSRPVIWRSAFRYIYDSPIIGIGLGPTIYFAPSHPHNSILQWAAELGLPSTLALVALISFGIFRWVGAVRTMLTDDSVNSLHAGLAATIIALLGYSLVSGVIVMPMAQTILVLVGGWILSVFRELHSSMTEANSQGTGRVLLVISAGLLAGFWFTLAPDFPLIFGDAATLSDYGPKFWDGVRAR